jgi:CubicO group peptidase (beta-lactamase class C family)
MNNSVLMMLAVGYVFAAQAQSLETRLDEVIKGSNRKWFMGSILIARGEEVLFQKSYGSADLKQTIANTAATRFYIGSITKQFTAAAVLMLEERGKLKTSDPINQYLPDNPTTWSDITIYHLLTHTSGIPDYVNTDDFDTAKTNQFSPVELIRIFRDQPLDFKPGEKEEYSNSNYVLLGCLIEKLSGQSYADFLRSNIFEPLVMNDTGVSQGITPVPGLATGYALRREKLLEADLVNFSSVYSAGAIYSVPLDLLRWQNGLFGGKLLSAEGLKKMTRPHLSGYACGLHVEGPAGDLVFYHGGRIDGFSAHCAYYPSHQLTVITLSNVWNREMAAINSELAATVRHWPPTQSR